MEGIPYLPGNHHLCAQPVSHLHKHRSERFQVGDLVGSELNALSAPCAPMPMDLVISGSNQWKVAVPLQAGCQEEIPPPGLEPGSLG